MERCVFRLDAKELPAFLRRARNVIARAKKFLLLLLGVLIKQQNPIKRLPRCYFSCCCCSPFHFDVFQGLDCLMAEDCAAEEERARARRGLSFFAAPNSDWQKEEKNCSAGRAQ